MTFPAKSWTAALSKFELTQRPRRRFVPRVPAFTLVEMVVVLVMMSLIAVSAVYSLRQPVQNARLERVLANLEDADRRARITARRMSRPIELKFDAGEGTIEQTVIDGDSQPNSRRSMALSGGIQLDRLQTNRQSALGGELRVRISSSGQSDTYALRVRAGERRQIWLMVVGATGQYVRTVEDSVVEEIFSLQK